jgi:hypothetical protein
MVAFTALVAGGWAWAASKGATWSKSALETAAWSEGTAANTGWGIAVTGKMSLETAGVAAAGGASEAESWAVGLNVANAGARVALLGLGGAWQWAAVGLVSWLLAVVAETLSRGALVGGVTNLAALVAGTTRKRRHCVFLFVYISVTVLV